LTAGRTSKAKKKSTTLGNHQDTCGSLAENTPRSGEGEQMKPPSGLEGLAVRRAVKHTGARILLVICLLFSLRTAARADSDDLDDYKWRISGLWWYAVPSGSFSSQGNSGTFDLQRDFGFDYFSTGSGFVDWRFKRKHHFIFEFTPLDHSRTATLTRTITFEGQMYEVGTQATVNLHTLGYSPGYQYDIIRRNHGYFGIGAQLYILDVKATVTGAATVNGQGTTRSVSGSSVTPVPTVGPRTRWYPLPSSSRLSLDAFIQGMYFFGYGDFWSARGTVNVGLVRHLSLVAGYKVGTNFSLHGSSNRLGVRLTDKGPVAGLEVSWGSQEK
jgi:hypothetical protein